MKRKTSAGKKTKPARAPTRKTLPKKKTSRGKRAPTRKRAIASAPKKRIVRASGRAHASYFKCGYRAVHLHQGQCPACLSCKRCRKEVHSCTCIEGE